jgi:hypothetical protein
MSLLQPPPDPRETLRRLSRDPTVDPGSPQTVADEFCRLACLTYGGADHPDRWARARAMLAEHPEIVGSSIAAAAAAADVGALSAHLAADPEAAYRETGPHDWAPLLYLTYSRVGTADEPADRFLDCTRLLLDAGADPDAGFLWRGLPSPFTALTGMFGEGEQGHGRDPRHPHSAALARLLLTAGAHPNDGQALYNRMFRPDDGHLVLLFEFGLGRADGGRWASLLGDLIESPRQMLSRQLGWAIDHGFGQRVELLIANGVDIRAPLADGRTPVEHAIAAGYRDIIDILGAAGASVPDLPDESALIGALLAGDADQVAEHPDLLAAARTEQPALIHRARTPAAVTLLAASGFDPDARHAGSTALHQAAFAGDDALITALLTAGADPNSLDSEHGTTPLVWAAYACHPGAIAVLEPVTGR